MTRQNCFDIVLIVFISLICVMPSGALAQIGNTIDFGQTVTGRITNEAFRVVYSFQGRKGDIIDVTLTATDDTLDPVLLLTDDQNSLLANADDSSGSFNAVVISQQLPQDGTYFMIVTRFGQERGLTTGGFSLTLNRVGLTAGSNTALQYGDSVVGELNAEIYQQVYAFRATRGDIIRASMQRISGNLDCLLILADAEGNVLISNDEDANSPGTLDAAFYDLRVKQTGNYLLVATRFGREAGDSRGGYSLSLDRLPPESLGSVPDKAILLDYGAKVAGSIDPENIMRYYSIDAKKGDVLTITAERNRGNLDPILVLYTSDLRELATNDSGLRGQNSRISAFNVPVDGTYIIMVSRFNREKGITAGGYLLTVAGRPGVTVGAGGKLNLNYESAANAIISDSSAEQQYMFTAVAGDVITVTMDVTAGNLVSALVLLDAAGKQIKQDDPGTGNAKMVMVRLTESGNYTIVATRRGRAKGTTQGTYVLSLTLENPRGLNP
jgi:hypothetical protein